MRARLRRLDEEKRRSLIDAAIDEIAANGIEGASYNRIIERSGLSKGAVYYYFENKESLYGMVLEEVEREFLEAVGTLKIPDDRDAFWDVCGSYYRKALDFAVSNMKTVEVARSLIEPSSGATPGAPAYESVRRVMRWVSYALRKGQDLGALRSDVAPELLWKMVRAIGHTMDSWLFDRLDDEDQVDAKEFVEFAMDMYRRVLSP
ncbi:MAG: TetR/AcrR family transcriptional regulator [Synergistaceae bacterium]|nr:TetR/AcrR family transcriptional regulator [Synergistota bacterium]NLM72125.1 TetR/AcrR family transcriptional regulator [Synergistaceae bacterium]